MIEQLAYVSRAAPDLTPGDVHDIIRTAHNRNPKQGLTGALVLMHGHFLQVLEGPPQAVQACVERIGRDRRHHAVEIRGRTRVERPDFPSHWMALRSDTDLPPTLRERMAPGFPAAQHDARALVDFARDCVDGCG